MELFLFGIFFITMFGLQIGASRLGKSHDLQLSDWLNGKVSTPFTNVSTPQKEAHHEDINKLKERIQVLEKIITDDAYQLNQQLNKL